MAFDCLLFDLDGTLVDSLPDLATAINLLRQDLHLKPLTLPQVASCVGDGATALVRSALPAGTFHPQKLQQFLDYYSEHLSEKTRPYSGVVALLEAFPQTPKAIVTNKPQQMAVQLLRDLNLSSYFKLTLGGDSYAQKKPHPRPLLEALSQLGYSPTSSLMIGDHHTDLRSAAAAGLSSCFCRWGYGNTGEELPDMTADTPCELHRMLAGL